MVSLPSGIPLGNFGGNTVPLETITFISGLTGQHVTFGDASMPNVLLKGVTGGGIAPLTNTAVETAYQPGAQFIRTKKGTSVIKVTLAVYGDPSSGNIRSSFYTTLQAIFSVLEPATTAAGSLVRVGGDGISRMLSNVQYVGGGEVEDLAANLAYVNVDLLFEAYDPIWRSTITHTAVLGNSQTSFGWTVPTVIPLVINGQAQSVAQLQNLGNISALPVYTFQGPAQNFSIANGTNGQSFFIGMLLNVGDRLVVDTKSQSITYTPAGGVATPLYSVFGGNQQWVSLAPGINIITFYQDQAANNNCFITWQDTWNYG